MTSLTVERVASRAEVTAVQMDGEEREGIDQKFSKRRIRLVVQLCCLCGRAGQRSLALGSSCSQQARGSGKVAAASVNVSASGAAG